MSDLEVALQPGQERSGFRVERVTQLHNLASVAYELRHLKTGARVLHLHRDDAENMLAIAFPTPPPDDTGLPHILEHSVLDGSRRYPAKKPFFEMVKMSMATFINAMTYSDKTVYPAASNVEKDFFNLAEVYCDAVFHPLLHENTLRQEGHRLDFAEKGNPDSALIVKGVVYNEMKGAFSSPDSLVYRESSKRLTPDTPYGKVSGGDPDAIPDLTYENFLRFHQELYHPANAYIFLYGDISTERHLDFLAPVLDEFDHQEAPSALIEQPRWLEPRSGQESYPVGPEDETAHKTYHSISWLIGSATDIDEVMAFTVLDVVLLGNQAAPLRKAIIDSKLGEDLSHAGYSAGYSLESDFRVGIKGSDPELNHDFLRLVMDTLERIAAEGLARERVEAAFQQLAYRYLEIQSMYPLHLMDRAYGAWIYGADPLTFLRAEEALERLRARWIEDPALFGHLIRERIINNPHRLTMTFVPDRDMQARKDAAFAERMAARKASLTPEDTARILREAEALEDIQNTPNSPEDVATLPQLRVSDVPAVPKHIPTAIEEAGGGVNLLWNDVFSHGVNYLQVDFDLDGLPDALVAYLPLYGDIIRKMGAAGHDYVRMAERVTSCTGGISFSGYAQSLLTDPSTCVPRARFSLKALDAQLPDALGVLRDYLFEADPSNTDRLREVLVQSRAAHRSSLASSGLSLAMHHASRSLSREAALSEVMGGLPQVRQVDDLVEHFESQCDEVIEKLLAIRRYLLGRGCLTSSFTGTTSKYNTVRETLGAWLDSMPAVSGPAAPTEPAAPWQLSTEPRREGLAAPMDVAYCVKVIPAPHLSDPDAPLLSVASLLLSLDYMLEEVRVKGGAYGAGVRHNAMESTWSFHSYRDPWVKRTLDVFAGLAEYVRRADWSQTQIDRAIIGAAKASERPIRPGEATGSALSRFLVGDTRELREARHAAILRATPGEVRRAVLDVLERSYDLGGVCVVSSREKLEKANAEMPDSSLAIEDIMH